MFVVEEEGEGEHEEEGVEGLATARDGDGEKSGEVGDEDTVEEGLVSEGKTAGFRRSMETTSDEPEGRVIVKNLGDRAKTLKGPIKDVSKGRRRRSKRR